MKLGRVSRGVLARAVACCALVLVLQGAPALAADAVPAASAAVPAAAPAVEPLQYSFGAWPPDLSTHGGRIQEIYDWIYWATGLTFLLTEGALLWFVFAYRQQEGKKAYYFHGHTGLEIVWTLLPVVIFVTLGVKSADVWSDMKDPARFPKDSWDVHVTGKQFEWLIQYPGKDRIFGTEDDYETINDLHVPYGKPVRVRLTAKDVLHSFFLPELRVKQDAVPGMETQVWFEATRAAETEIACAELCGLGHYRMKGKLTIQSLADADKWVETEKSNE